MEALDVGSYIFASLVIAAIVGVVRMLWSTSIALASVKTWAEQHQREDDERHKATMEALRALSATNGRRARR